MILEAIKNKRFQDFGIPTPDEKLRSDIGDQTFDKIQSLDKNQRDAMKQTFDPDYPRDIKLETFENLVEPYGFKPHVSKIITAKKFPIRVKAYDNYRFSPTESDRFFVSYSFVEDDYFPVNPQNFLEYKIELWDQSLKDNSLERRGRTIVVPDMFEIDLTTDEGDQTAMSLIIAKEKEAILDAMVKYK